MRYIATVSITSKGLYEEEEYINANEQDKAIYFDLGWSGQLKMIENELKTLMYKRLNDNGYLIFYMFNNNRYTTGRKKIQENLNNFWGTSNLNPPSIIKTLNNLNSKYKIKFINPETSRSIITWITLKK